MATVPRLRRELADDPKKRDVVKVLYENNLMIARTLRGLTLAAEDAARYCAELLGVSVALEAIPPSAVGATVQVTPKAPPHANVHVVDQALARAHGIRGAAIHLVEPKREPATSPKDLKRGARDMVAILRTYHPRRLSRVELAIRIGISPKGTSMLKYLSQLRSARIIDEDGRGVGLSETAESVIRETPSLAVSSQKRIALSASEIADLWTKSLKRGARDILDALIAERAGLANSSGWVTFETLAEMLSPPIDPKGTSMLKYISQLRSPGLIVTEGRKARASEALFITRGQ